jgi:uncharacterized membrane protein YuzA (DUF378 family)
VRNETCLVASAGISVGLVGVFWRFDVIEVVVGVKSCGGVMSI